MNKVAAEIIAGLIPRKMARNRWRGILRYGVIKALKLKFRLKRNHRKPDCRLAVCAIAKDERPYFKEWLDWHISQAWRSSTSMTTKAPTAPAKCSGPTLSPCGDTVTIPGYRRQIAAY